MKILKGNYINLINKTPLTVSIGNFDGIHIGHQQLIRKAKSFADTKSGVIFFSPHPMKVLRDISYQTLTSVFQKLKLMENFGVDYSFVVDFSREFSQLSKDEFINFLKSLAVKRVVIGKDFRFAAYASGSINDLKKHFKVVECEDILSNHIRVSSTYVKDLITNGNLEDAAKMLGRAYELSGVVIHGQKVGKTLGMPTANLDVKNYVLPPNGVYYVEVVYNDKLYGGAMNIGYNPTLNYSVNKRVEVHLLNFNGNLYGEVLLIEIKKYLRPEYKFNNKEELIAALKKDIDLCDKLFKLGSKKQ